MKITTAFAVRALIRVSLAGAACLSVASAGNINVVNQDIGTATGNWLVTAVGAANTNAPAFVLPDGSISITNDAKSNGTYISGATQPFNGFWMATFNFFLPQDATAPSLIFSGLRADDRAVLELNGHPIGDASVGAGGGVLTGPGLMSFSSALSNTGTCTAPYTGTCTYTFSGTVASAAPITSFIQPGANTLTLYVNNTGLGTLSALTSNFLTGGDYTGAALNGTFSFTTTTPEPGTISLLIAGLGPLAYWLRKRRTL